jgi:hypothetical protein
VVGVVDGAHVSSTAHDTEESIDLLRREFPALGRGRIGPEQVVPGV